MTKSDCQAPLDGASPFFSFLAKNILRKKSGKTAQKSVQNERRRKMLAFFYDRMQPRTP